MQIIVLGMHRSGTSLVTRTLNLMGAYLGPEGTMMPATRDNPKGYWERLDIVHLNEWLLKSAGFSWDKVFHFDVDSIAEDLLDEFNDKATKIISDMDTHRPWVIKDPRLCLLFPLWRKLLDVPICIHIFRSPIQIAQSLRKRDNFPLQYGIALWQKYQSNAFTVSSGLPKISVSYEKLVTEPLETVSFLHDSLMSLEVQGLRLPGNKEITSFIDPKLQREKSDSDLDDAFLSKNQLALIKFAQEEFYSEDKEIPKLSSEFLTVLNDYECLIESRQSQKDLSRQLMEAQREVVGLNLSFEEQTRELRDQQVEMATARNTLQQLSEEYRLEAAKLNEQIEEEKQERQVEVAALRQQLEAKQRDLDGLHLSFESQTKHLLNQNEQILSLKEQLREKTANIENLNTSVEDLQVKLGQNQVEIEGLHNSVEIQAKELMDRDSQLKRQMYNENKNIQQLTGYFEKLSYDIQAVFNSLTWRIGFFIAEGLRKITLKSSMPTAQDHIRKVMQDFFNWKNSYKNTDDPFEEDVYVSQNPDIGRAINNRDFKTARQHWEEFGKKEIASEFRQYVPGVILKNPFEPRFKSSFRDQIRRYISGWENPPCISVIMPAYNVDKRWLHEAIESVANQTYPYWELCIADDCSTSESTLNYLRELHGSKIRVKFLQKNQGISGASNAALSLAKGDYVALLDNDDLLTENALYEVARIINRYNPDLIYSDEDKITVDGGYVEPHFKPNYSPDLLFSTNYICHLSVFRKSLLDQIGGFRTGFEGSQDYDLVLRFSEKTNNIYHIPKVLYHWRKIPGSTAAVFDNKSYAWEAGRVALEEAIQRRNIVASAELGMFPGTYRVKYNIISQPLVSIIIPFKDKPDLLKTCIDSILQMSSYSHFEILGISNNSTEPELFELMQYYQNSDKRISFREYNIPYNYSAINNYAVNFAQGEHIVLLNNDVVVISPNWIEALLEHSQRPEVGAVGAKLYYPDDTVQHAGISIGVLGLAAHSHRYFPKDSPGYFARLCLIQNVSALTGACLMVNKQLYESIGGLDEKNLAVAFNDVDFCLRLRERGLLNIYTPYCELYHYESKSRGLEDTPEKQTRFINEVDYMHKRHSEIIAKGDPYYNPNLTIDSEDFEIDLHRVSNTTLESYSDLFN